MKISIAIRFILAAFLITGAWLETGPFTGVCLILIFLSGEILLWGLGDLLREEGLIKIEEWKRAREARRKR